MFRYFNLLAPVLGNELVFVDVDGSASDTAVEPLMDHDPAMCTYKCDDAFLFALAHSLINRQRNL